MVSLLFDLRVAGPLQNPPTPDGLIFNPACDVAFSRRRTTTTVVEEVTRAVLGPNMTSGVSMGHIYRDTWRGLHLQTTQRNDRVDFPMSQSHS